jgi:hypothetical protein
MIKIVAAAAMVLASPIAAIAAPYCLLISNAAPQCMYYDGRDCARDAGRQNGSCIANPNEVHVAASQIGQYCVIVAGGYSTCGYADPNECARDALQQKGVCSRSSGAPPQQLPNAYDPNAGR